MYESVVTLYRVFCQPTAFLAETKGWRFGRRLWFMLRMTPAILLAQLAIMAGVSLIALALGADGIDARAAVVFAVLSLLGGMVWGAVWSVAMGVAWGVAWGAAEWVILEGLRFAGTMESASSAVALLLSVSMALAKAGHGAPLGLAFGVGLGVTLRAARGAWWGVALGIGFGVVLGAAGGGGGLVAVVTRIVVGYSGLAVVVVSFLVGYFRVEWYPLDAAATLWQLGKARRRPRLARALLRRSPIYWREPIWLPLIGLKSFLRLVDEDDPHAALEECLFVMLERPTQRRVARATLMETTARHMAALGSVQEIAASAEAMRRGQERAEQVAEGRPMPLLPDDVGRGGSALAELARLAEQHVAATLPHNRRRALERLRDGAESLQRELILSGASFSGVWAGAASRWREVAESALEEMGEAEQAAGFIYNPFVFGQPIEETETNLFVGRRDVVREIEVSLLGAAQKPTLVLWGPRRMGKTSVLKQLPRLLGSEFAPAFIDMQAVQVRESVRAFFRGVTQAAAAGLRRRGVEVEELGEPALGESPFGAFAEWMEKVEEGLGEGRYLLLCLDEFERLEASIREGKLPSELMDQIRHVIQHHPRIVLVFAGSHRPDEMALNWPDVLISTRLIRVSYLREEEARQLITEPAPDFGVSYGEGSVERILEVTRCQPNLVQAVCYELVNHLNVEGRREARREDVEGAVGQALESAHLYFAEMWQQVSETQRRVLAEIARASERAQVEELVTAAGAARDKVEADLRVLEGRGIIEAADDRRRFQVPMVGEWVRRREG